MKKHLSAIGLLILIWTSFIMLFAAGGGFHENNQEAPIQDTPPILK